MVMAKRNLTVQLDEEVIRKARIVAAERSLSISRLVAQQIETLVGDEDAYEAAEREAIARLERGFDLGGEPLGPREQLHER